jgi:mRNA deadenylase 3'-5' endonuclease subunit Ccr4
MIVVGLIRRSHAFQTKSPSLQQSSKGPWKSPFRLFQSPLTSKTIDHNHEPVLSSSSGTLVARILPKEYVDYERFKKPISRRSENVAIWSERVRPNSNNELAVLAEEVIDDRGQQEEMLVTLDVNINTRIFDEKTKQLLPIQVQLHLHRQADETAQRTLQRMEISTRRRIDSFRVGKCEPSLHIRASSSGSTPTEDINTCVMVWDPAILDNDSFSEAGEDLASDGYRRYPINKEMKSDELWKQLMQYPKRLIWLDVLKEDPPGVNLQLDPCPPTLLSVRTFENFAADLFVGVPSVIETKLLHAERALIVWFVGERQVCYDSHIYTPLSDDVGKDVSVLISPTRPGFTTGHEEVYHFDKVVQERPRLAVLDNRASWLPRQQEDDSTLRVMSYNLLADLYTSREINQKTMYNHCEAEFIVRTRRMPLLVHEILMHQPDIICLQEVDSMIYDQLLLPVLKAHGYQGYYSNKASVQLEGEIQFFKKMFLSFLVASFLTISIAVVLLGCAMFWSLRLFEKDAYQEEFALRDVFETVATDDSSDAWDSMADIQSLLQRKPDLRHIIQEKVGQVLQVATLRLKNPNGKAEQLVVGNTHLFYHPMADHIRAMQAYIVCKQMDKIRRQDSRQSAPSPLIFCGDLNSDPLSGAMTLLLNRQLGPEHFETWKNLDEYTWEKGEDDFLMEHGFIGNDVGEEPVYVDESFRDAHQEIVSDTRCLPGTVLPRIRLPACFPDLISGYTETPEFTNYAVDFAETLDYILASRPSCVEEVGFEVVSSAPVLTKSEMEVYVAMPNENMPSDHVSIACDLKWKRYQK